MSEPAATRPRTSAGVSAEPGAVSPQAFLQLANGYQRSAAIKAAIELDVFTALADGPATAATVAATCQASVRGMTVLCDYLVILGLLQKEDLQYRLPHESFVFLNRRSPAYVGSAVEFLLAPENVAAFADLTSVVRGGTGDPTLLVPDSARWVRFARSMAPLMAMPAEGLAELLDVAHAGPVRVLDIAAGHGLFGIAMARRNPEARIVAVDWEPVIEVARENAGAAGVAGRYETRAGDAMTLDAGRDFDLVLLTNFLHHFDEATNVALLRRLRTAMRPGGRIAALEFVPNEDRVTPPVPAAFAMTMLALTPAGQAYPFSALQRMFGEAGFDAIALHDLPPSPERVVTAERAAD